MWFLADGGGSVEIRRLRHRPPPRITRSRPMPQDSRIYGKLLHQVTLRHQHRSRSFWNYLSFLAWAEPRRTEPVSATLVRGRRRQAKLHLRVDFKIVRRPEKSLRILKTHNVRKVRSRFRSLTVLITSRYPSGVSQTAGG